MSDDPNFQVHVLVVTETDDGEKEWEVEHPDCPRACPWWPGAAADAAERADEEARLGFALPSLDHYTCYVAWELEQDGLETLEGEIDGVHHSGGSHYTNGRWERDLWRRIPPGRYLIEGWYTPSGWAGSEPFDADGGIALLGRENADTPVLLSDRRQQAPGNGC